jgi:hypothetical protein
VNEGLPYVLPPRRDEVVIQLEPWLDKHGIAKHFDCSVRWILLREEEGMPCAMIAGRLKFKVSIVEPWLEDRGFIERRGEAA